MPNKILNTITYAIAKVIVFVLPRKKVVQFHDWLKVKVDNL